MSQENIPIESKEPKDAMEIQQALPEPLQEGIDSSILPSQVLIQESPSINPHAQMLSTYLPPQDHGLHRTILQAEQGQQNRNPPFDNNEMEDQEYPITQQQAIHFKKLRSPLKRPNQAHLLRQTEKATSQMLTQILKRMRHRMYIRSNMPLKEGLNGRRIHQILRFHIEDRLIYLILKFQGQQQEEMVDIYKMRKHYEFELGEYVRYCFYFLQSFEKMVDITNLDELQANYLSQIFGLLGEQDKNFEDLAPFELKNIYEKKERKEKQEILKERLMKEKLQKKEQDIKKKGKKKQEGKEEKMVPQNQYDEDYHSPFDWAPS